MQMSDLAGAQAAHANDAQFQLCAYSITVAYFPNRQDKPLPQLRFRQTGEFRLDLVEVEISGEVSYCNPQKLLMAEGAQCVEAAFEIARCRE